MQQELIDNVWCSGCSEPTTIIDFTGIVKSNDLVLQGYCKRCGGAVARVIENEE
jgi:hypothetical protein